MFHLLVLNLYATCCLISVVNVFYATIFRVMMVEDGMIHTALKGPLPQLQGWHFMLRTWVLIL